MLGAGGGARKIDCTTRSVVDAGAPALWPFAADVTRWPSWLKDARGRGLARAEKLPHVPGSVDATNPVLGQRFRLTFTSGLEAEFQLTYWVEPAQMSLGLVRETRKQSRGVEGMIFDLDLSPRRDGSTLLWFGALLLLEKGFRPSLLARWPKQEVMAWVEGFHARLGEEAPKLTKGARLKKEAAAVLQGARDDPA